MYCGGAIRRGGTGAKHTWPKEARDIFIMLGMYVERDNLAMPVSNTVLCLYLQRQSLTVDPENLETKLSAFRYLHERLLGFA